MPQDLGQEAGEWLLNRNGGSAWRALNLFVSKARAASRERHGAAEEVVAVDFANEEGAREASELLGMLGYEHERTGSSICMLGRDVAPAAEGCYRLAERGGTQPGAEPGGAAPARGAPTNQLGFIERLAADGHLGEADLARARQEGFTTRDADAMIKHGRAVRDKAAVAEPSHVREEGAAAQAASQRLASERGREAVERSMSKGARAR